MADDCKTGTETFCSLHCELSCFMFDIGALRCLALA